MTTSLLVAVQVKTSPAVTTTSLLVCVPVSALPQATTTLPRATLLDATLHKATTTSWWDAVLEPVPDWAATIPLLDVKLADSM